LEKFIKNLGKIKTSSEVKKQKTLEDLGSLGLS